MKKLNKSKRAGTFALAPDREIYGELTVSGANTSLYLRDNDEFNTRAVPERYLQGSLYDLTKVSLIDCITTSGPGHVTRGSHQYHFARIFPHFIAHGDRFVTPTEKSIVQIHFLIDDATTLFHDPDAFGCLIDASPFIEAIANANNLHLKVTTGPHAKIAYFTGKTQIFEADTVLGKVSASHSPRIKFGGPKGAGFKNSIFVTIAYDAPVLFAESIDGISTLLRFFEMLVGRPQNILNVSVQLAPDQHNLPVLLDVYWNLGPKRAQSNTSRKPDSFDVLLDGSRHPEEFSRVLSNWLERDESWRDARGRFSGCFAKQNSYTIDRLIAAANMFDILPSSAVPESAPLSQELKDAKDKCRSTFLALPRSDERDSFLSALGWIGETRLKQKIRHRIGTIVAAKGDGRFPELAVVTDAAVVCRNHYVHGSGAQFDYNTNFHAVTFFTDTLEFVFAASDLVDAGWDLNGWSNAPTVMSHPFAAFRINYTLRLAELKALLGA